MELRLLLVAEVLWLTALQCCMWALQHPPCFCLVSLLTGAIHFRGVWLERRIQNTKQSQALQLTQALLAGPAALTFQPSELKYLLYPMPFPWKHLECSVLAWHCGVT